MNLHSDIYSQQKTNKQDRGLRTQRTNIDGELRVDDKVTIDDGVTVEDGELAELNQTPSFQAMTSSFKMSKTTPKHKRLNLDMVSYLDRMEKQSPEKAQRAASETV